MAEITFKGNHIHIGGDLQTVGEKAPSFALTKHWLKKKKKMLF